MTVVASQAKTWKQQFKVLSRKTQTYRKQINKILPISSNEQPLAQKIAQMFIQAQQYDLRVQKQQAVTNSKLQGLKKNIESLKDTVKHFTEYEQSNQYLVKVQTQSEGIFEKMQNFKGKMAAGYDQLDNLQERLNQELQLYEKKIQAMEEGTVAYGNQQNRPTNIEQDKAHSKQSYSQKKQPMNRSKQIESRNKSRRPPIPNIKKKEKMQGNGDQFGQIGKQVEHEKVLIELQKKMRRKEQQCQQIEGQIRSLGKNLGWVEQDHQDFIVIWNRSSSQKKSYFEIQDQLLSYFNLYTEQQVKDHMNKYIKLKKLQQNKKQVISQYKLVKQEKKSEQLKRMQLVEMQDDKKKKQQEHRTKVLEQQKLRKQQVQQWKSQKEEQKRRRQQDEALYQKVKKDITIQKRNEDQNRRKQLLMQWKQQKQEKTRSQVENSRRRPNSAISKETQERIRQRQEKIVKQRIQRAIHKKIQQEQNQKKKEEFKQKNMLKFAYVAPKFEENTVAVKEKKRDKFDGKNKKEANTFGGQLLMSGRAIPAWRQGL